jgi:hypothetical protein
VLSKLVYLALRHVISLLVLLARGDATKDIEVVVLRHQLAALRRQIPRPKLQPTDRTLLAALSRALPRVRWSVFLATPDTIMRWHRRLVTRKWTQPYCRGGRPPLAEQAVALSCGWPERTRSGGTDASKAS